MDNTILIIAFLIFLPIFVVLLYNTYQEKQYRDSVRAQFGHADKDALLESYTQSVHDGMRQEEAEKALLKPALREYSIGKTAKAEPVAPSVADSAEQAESSSAKEQAAEPEQESAPKADAFPEAPVEAKPERSAKKRATILDSFMPSSGEQAPSKSILQTEVAADNSATNQFAFQKVAQNLPSRAPSNLVDSKLLLDLPDLAKQELPWFDSRFDYLAYVSLAEPQELHAMPRLSSRHRFRLAGCTMDDRFQIAEPIPSVYYQGFVIGLQAISRNGLATIEELEQFGEQVNAFAEKMNGGILLTDIDTFLNIARPLDELCARVDQTIAIHLVSRGNISGTELRAAVEQQKFELSHDGRFHYNNSRGEPLFSIITLDNSPFTSTLLSAQNYRGFSLLFDVTHIPDGEKNFNRFMDIAVKLSSTLSLDLVNDNLEELSTEWLKDIRSYVIARQDEMKQVGIEPGSELAQRLFS